MHFLMLTFLVIATFAVMAVLFVVWVIAAILRGFTRLITGPGLREKPRISPPAMQAIHTSATAGVRPCPRENCRAANPAAARFCKRCGHGFQPAQTVQARRVAML
jgi:hypothetical protein